MSFNERIAWATLASVLVVYGVYFAIVLSASTDTPLAEIQYQGLMIITVIVLVAMLAIAAIVAAIADPKAADTTDERDKVIDQRGGNLGGIILGAFVLVPLGLAMIDADTFWIAQAILAALVLGQVAEEVTKVVAYRRGA